VISLRRSARLLSPALLLAGIFLTTTANSASADTVSFTSAQIGTQGSTPSFSQTGPWTMAWSFDCTSYGSPGNFGVNVNQPSNDLNDDIGPNELAMSGSGTDFYYDAGTFNLDVISECDWTINIAPSSAGPLSTPVSFSSQAVGDSGATQQFSVGGAWTMAWSYNCANYGSQGNFGVEVNQPANDLNDDTGPNELGNAGSGTDSYTDTGVFSLDVLSECDWTIAINSAAPTPSPAPSPNPSPSGSGGYDLVGSDGGVFVFGSSSGYYGSLPGLGIHVNNIVGIVPSATDTGYFLVGSDGGVFAFNTTFAGSLPGLGVHINDIVGIVPNFNDTGYFLVGRDGGVFAFNTTYAGSLPGIGVHVDNIVGIAPTADDNGYWVVSSNGIVYPFGDAASYGDVPGAGGTQIKGIAATPDNRGYWLIGSNGTVFTFGDATNYGDLSDANVSNIVSLVPAIGGGGYWLIGSNGGVYPFGDAASLGSLPALGVHVTNVVGGVPTSS
jgi:hypothetical protein